MKKIIFVTGTDTGVGKTLLTSFLLFHLRQTGVHALAMKPFCSGGRDDVRRLQQLQKGELSDDQVNPFYFAKPLAPFVAAGKKRTQIRLDDVVKRIHTVAGKCEQLIVEGSGGLLVPLGEDFTVLDLIGALDCEVIITARNQLGTINHTLLTVKALDSAGIRRNRMKIALMGVAKTDFSARTNHAALAELLDVIEIVKFPFLGAGPLSGQNLTRNHVKIRSGLKNLLK